MTKDQIEYWKNYYRQIARKEIKALAPYEHPEGMRYKSSDYAFEVGQFHALKKRMGKRNSVEVCQKLWVEDEKKSAVLTRLNNRPGSATFASKARPGSANFKRLAASGGNVSPSEISQEKEPLSAKAQVAESAESSPHAWDTPKKLAGPPLSPLDLKGSSLLPVESAASEIEDLMAIPEALASTITEMKSQICSIHKQAGTTPQALATTEKRMDELQAQISAVEINMTKKIDTIIQLLEVR